MSTLLHRAPLRGIALGLAVACATGCSAVRPRPVAASAAPSPDARTRAIAIATSRFATFAAKGDSAGMRAMLANDAVLYDGRDSVRGAAAVVGRLLRPASLGWTELVLASRAQVLCESEGAFELGVFTRYARRDSTNASVEAGGDYGFRWGETAGQPTISIIALDGSGRQASARSVRCASLARSEFRQHRAFLTTSLRLGLGGSSPHDNLTSGLANRGWGRTVPLCTNYGTSPGYPAGYDCGASSTTTVPPIETVGARLRLTSLFGIEGYTQLGERGGTAVGYKGSDSSFIIQNVAARERMLLATVEWRNLRAGVGAASVKADWNNYSDRFVPISGPQGGYQYEARPERQQLTTSATGLGVQLAYSVNVVSRFALEVVGRSRSGLKASLPALGRFPQSEQEFDGYSLTIGGALGL